MASPNMLALREKLAKITRTTGTRKPVARDRSLRGKDRIRARKAKNKED